MAQPSDGKCGGPGGTIRFRFSVSTLPESDKHVCQAESSQKVFTLIIPQGDTSAINNSRDCVGCHCFCIHRHTASESLLLTCLFISWLQRWKGRNCDSDGRQRGHLWVFESQTWLRQFVLFYWFVLFFLQFCQSVD